jgi:hypothetical protein
MRMVGRSEVARLESLVDGAFSRYSELPTGSQVQSDFARYLCVLVAGFMEQATQELALEWCRKQSSPSIQRFAAQQLDRLQNVNSDRLCKTVGSFSADWRAELEADFKDELAALSGLMGNRHLIAHGGTVTVSYAQVRESFDQIKVLVEFLKDRFDPAPAVT